MKFNDILLGYAIGDSFGAGIEFQDRNWIKENMVHNRYHRLCLKTLKGKNTYSWLPTNFRNI